MFKVIDIGGNRKPVYDFLLVINSNLGLISFHPCDGRTDRRTDRIAMAKTRFKQ